MKYAYYCFKCALLLLKINLTFMLVFQTLKLVLSDTNAGKQIEIQGHSIRSGLNNGQRFLVKLSSHLSSQLSETEYPANDWLALKISSIYYLRETIVFNGMRLLLKGAFIYNLTLSCVLTNILVISYMLIKRHNTEKMSKTFTTTTTTTCTKKFLKLNLILNNLFLLVILFFNFVCIYADLFGLNLSSSKNGIINTSDQLMYTTNNNLIIICLIMLGIYAFIMQCDDHYDSVTVKDSSKKKLLESVDLAEDCGDLIVRLDFDELKRKKLERKAGFNIQLMIHSLMLIAMLNVWDTISDTNDNSIDGLRSTDQLKYITRQINQNENIHLNYLASDMTKENDPLISQINNKEDLVTSYRQYYYYYSNKRLALVFSDLLVVLLTLINLFNLKSNDLFVDWNFSYIFASSSLDYEYSKGKILKMSSRTKNQVFDM